MHKRYYLLSIAIFSAICLDRVFAVTYLDLPGISPLTDESTVENYATYFYALIVAVLVAIAVVKVTFSGLDLLTSGGSPAAFSKLKNDLIGVIVGLAVLLSPLLILKTINSDFPTDIVERDCAKMQSCILKEIIKPKTETEPEKTIRTVEMTIPNQDIKDNGKLTIKKYYGLQAVIGFNGGPATVFYADNPNNDDYSQSLKPGEEVTINVPLLGGNGQRDPKNPDQYNDNPGLVILDKVDGALLYEQDNYTPYLYLPLRLKGTYTNLDLVNYKDNVNSIDIVNSKKAEGIDYFGIAAQEDDSIIGKCAAFNKDIPSVRNDERLSKLGGEMNYITIYKRDKNYFKDMKVKLYIYNNTSCSEEGAEVEGRVKTVQLKYCEVTLLGLDKDVPSTDSNAGILPDCTPEGDKCSIT
ncbi:MAG: hypothetical protein PHW52_00530, partial [Candidatus Pacebacteria bacterium]|nr:hypothetical protein [Candidatus Paceibacterota bacterium]